MKKEGILKLITHVIIVAFLVIHLMQGNFEFLGHITIALILFWIVMYAYNKYNFPFILLLGFVLWLFLHLLGGTDVLGVRVYGLMLLDLTGPPLFFFRYDQFLHFYCYLIITPILYFITKKEVKKMTPFLLLLVIIAGIGVGALNEVFEFTMVMLLPETGVGDYYNNAFDLVMNTLGAVIGVLWAHKYSLKKK